jgi:putative Holliday junction resolvase
MMSSFDEPPDPTPDEESAASRGEQRSSSPGLPREGRLLGLDYGTKRVGVAISTPEQSFASPLETYTRRDRSRDETYFASLVRDHRIVGVVVGLPMHTGGEEGVKAGEARAFGKWISGVMQRPVDFADERFTSAIAEDMLREAGVSLSKWKARIDKIAAQIFLQAYLDARRDAAMQ